MELVEAAIVEARRVGDSSLAGVEFSLVGPVNHEVPQENKPAEDTKQRKRKVQKKPGEQSFQTECTGEKVQSVSKNHLMDSLCIDKRKKGNTSKLYELSVRFLFHLSLYQYCNRKNTRE